MVSGTTKELGTGVRLGRPTREDPVLLMLGIVERVGATRAASSFTSSSIVAGIAGVGVLLCRAARAALRRLKVVVGGGAFGAVIIPFSSVTLVPFMIASAKAAVCDGSQDGRPRRGGFSRR